MQDQPAPAVDVPADTWRPSPLDADLQVAVSRLLDTARRQLDMPVVFLTRFGPERREVQAVSGEHPSVRVGHSDPLDDTYCAGIVGGWIPQVIPDARREPSTRGLPTTTALGIGAYVGVPVALPDGTMYGTLCSFSADAEPALTLRDAQVLRVPAEAAAGLIEPEIAAAAQRARLAAELDLLLAAGDPQMVFQPVQRLDDGTSVGVEALSRFGSRSDLTTPGVFDLARLAGRTVALEHVAVERALSSLSRLRVPLSLNVSPELLLAPALWSTLSQVPLDRVVLELTEQQEITDYDDLCELLRPWQQRGLRLAIDDAGAGFAGLRHLVQLEPDFVKLDLSLVRGVASDPRRRAMVSALVAYTASIGAHVIAEGIEDSAELEALLALGVVFGQGHALAQPCTWEELEARGLVAC